MSTGDDRIWERMWHFYPPYYVSYSPLPDIAKDNQELREEIEILSNDVKNYRRWLKEKDEKIKMLEEENKECAYCRIPFKSLLDLHFELTEEIAKLKNRLKTLEQDDDYDFIPQI